MHIEFRAAICWNPWGVICLPVAILVIILGVVLSVLLADNGDGLVAIGVVFCVLGVFVVVFALVMCTRRQRLMMAAQPVDVLPPTAVYASPDPRVVGYRGREFAYEAGNIDDEVVPTGPRRARSLSAGSGANYCSPYANVQPVDYATAPKGGRRWSEVEP